jgi:hypothetical protein
MHALDDWAFSNLSNVLSRHAQKVRAAFNADELEMRS